MQRRRSTIANVRVLLVAPKAPPYGGMGIQAAVMHDLLVREGVPVTFLASNPPFPHRLRILENVRGMRPFLRSVWLSVQLWRALGRVDVVHVFACSWLYFFCVVSPAVVMSRVRGKRVVLNYHGGEADEFLRLWSWAVRCVFRLAHVVTAPSGFVEHIIRKRVGTSPEVVPNVVDFSAFEYRERKAVQPKMLVTRHLELLYDVATVIRAVAEVQKRYPEASLRIAGTGTQEPHLRQLAVALGVRNVEFLGHVPYAALPDLYAKCDILMNASRADNFPGSLIEAAACGLVVISTAVGGIPYLFENGKTALFVTPGDVKGLATAVTRVVEEPETAASLTREAVRHCRDYEWTRVRQRLFHVYGFRPEGAAASAPASVQEALPS